MNTSCKSFAIKTFSTVLIQNPMKDVAFVRVSHKVFLSSQPSINMDKKMAPKKKNLYALIKNLDLITTKIKTESLICTDYIFY